MRTSVSLAIAVCLAMVAHAEEPCPAEAPKPEHRRHEEPKHERVGWRVADRPHTAERAGCPQSIAKHAQCDRTDRDFLGYIGGGCFGWRGEGRCLDEGTIGWDYALFKRPGLIFLSWCHCREKQPVVGPYKSDGPRVPDVFALRPLKRLHEGKGEE